jgi:hypothetical protein
VQPGEHRAEGNVEHPGDLLGEEAVHVDQHERDPVQLRHPLEHRCHVRRPERLQEVQVQGFRVRERVLIGDLAIQRELLNVIEVDFRGPSRSGPAAVAAAVDQDAGQPGRAGLRRLELLEPFERLQQAVLDRVLGVVTDQPPSHGHQPRQLFAGQGAEALRALWARHPGCLVTRNANHAHIIGTHPPHSLLHPPREAIGRRGRTVFPS